MIDDSLEFEDEVTAAMELLSLAKEGRVIVLPCALGQKLYVIGTCEIISGREFGCPYAHECPDDICCEDLEDTYRIFPDKVADCWYGETSELKPEVFLEWLDIVVTEDDIGKTVFKTLEEAEAALPGYIERMKAEPKEAKQPTDWADLPF